MLKSLQILIPLIPLALGILVLFFGLKITRPVRLRPKEIDDVIEAFLKNLENDGVTKINAVELGRSVHDTYSTLISLEAAYLSICRLIKNGRICHIDDSPIPNGHSGVINYLTIPPASKVREGRGNGNSR